MCEVTKDNFEQKFSEINFSIEKAKFIAIDLEFSALTPLDDNKPRYLIFQMMRIKFIQYTFTYYYTYYSLFDSMADRYLKLRANLEHVVPVQVGLTMFHFDSEQDDYYGEVFTFYVLPACFPHVKKSYYFETSTTQFLSFYNFDFNKVRIVRIVTIFFYC